MSTVSTHRDSVLTADEESKLDVTKIPGYYKRKHSHEINTTFDFINKLRKTGVLQKFFTKNDVEFGGIKTLFTDLFDKLEKFILEDQSMQKDYKVHLHEIHEVLMFQLHSEFFYN